MTTNYKILRDAIQEGVMCNVQLLKVIERMEGLCDVDWAEMIPCYERSIQKAKDYVEEYQR